MIDTPEKGLAYARLQDALTRIEVAMRGADAEAIVDVARRVEVLADSCEPSNAAADYPIGSVCEVRSRCRNEWLRGVVVHHREDFGAPLIEVEVPGYLNTWTRDLCDVRKVPR